MARRVIIRSRQLGTDVAKLEEMIKADWKELWKNHQEELESICDEVLLESQELVPIDSGALRNSIVVRRSHSNRYPGIIAHASAKASKGFDYALIQEENEDYTHGEKMVDETTGLEYEEEDRMAHYLGGPFAREISYWYEELTGEPLELPDELQHAIDYIEERGK